MAGYVPHGVQLRQLRRLAPVHQRLRSRRPEGIAAPRQVEVVRHADGRSIIEGRGASARSRERRSSRRCRASTRRGRRPGSREGKARRSTARSAPRPRRGTSTTTYCRWFEGSLVIGRVQMDARFGNLQSGHTRTHAARGGPSRATFGRSRRRFRRVANRASRRAGKVPALERGGSESRRTSCGDRADRRFSPHLPFWKIVAEPFTFYQRIDGPLFAALTFERPRHLTRSRSRSRKQRWPSRPCPTPSSAPCLMPSGHIIQRHARSAICAREHPRACSASIGREATFSSRYMRGTDCGASCISRATGKRSSRRP